MHNPVFDFCICDVSSKISHNLNVMHANLMSFHFELIDKQIGAIQGEIERGKRVFQLLLRAPTVVVALSRRLWLVNR